MYQHTVVSAAPACGVGVSIRSHVQALWSPGTQGGPSQPRQVLGARVAPYHGLPWACSSARCWAPHGSTLFFVPHRSTESAPAHVMTTMQPILALRHVYEPAVQLCRTDSVVSAMANSTLGSPHHHLRKGECAGAKILRRELAPRARIALKPLKPHVSIRDDLGPQTAVCTHCKARHWECERSKSTRHFSACCSQGKVRLPPPPQPNLEYRQLLQGSDSGHIPRKRPVAQQRAVFHFDQTRIGTLGLPVFRVFGRLYHRLGALIPAVNQRPAFAQTWLIDPAEATNTRLQGPDSAETRIQRSTLTKLESMLRTGNCFVREFASAKGRAGWDTAKEWVLRLCLPPGRDRRTHNLPTTLFSRCTVIDVPMVGPSTKSLARSIRPRCLSVTHYFFLQGKMASTPTFLFAGSTKPGRQSPETESRSTMVSNCARYLPVLVWMTKTNRRTKTATMRMKTARKGTKRMVMANVCVFGRVSRSHLFAYYLHKRDEYFSIPHCTQRHFLEFVIDGFLSRDRSTPHVRYGGKASPVHS
ncbi:BQ5605_C001g00080 [Microbotryum silenes-dioicae]|uniref:BQ5605_C001g00080 protein n=1 Tax=Microbotryum silenes-dioicae TaxID=796604 RepID=A0A2X0M292_9BASI|nr:BQ5605_C001g00080 [Microbotryum silenes-dioicae]